RVLCEAGAAHPAPLLRRTAPAAHHRALGDGLPGRARHRLRASGLALALRDQLDACRGLRLRAFLVARRRGAVLSLLAARGLPAEPAAAPAGVPVDRLRGSRGALRHEARGRQRLDYLHPDTVSDGCPCTRRGRRLPGSHALPGELYAPPATPAGRRNTGALPAGHAADALL